ncbi:MAG: coproporphyrinogen III oxidase family protein, partial [Gemmatimonadota bacterium]
MRHRYVHVPFCRRRCVYCDFSIAVRHPVPSESFVAAVRAERDARSALEQWEADPLETLYLGGGTPSLLAAEAVAELVEQLATERAPGAEITLEANPDDVTTETAAAWVGAGVNRVSLGAQSFEPRVLEWMHRTHEAAASERAVGLLRGAGVASVSLDLIFALPESLGRDFGRELARALELEPDHLSVYGLTAEPRTAWGRWVAGGTSRPAPEDLYAEEFLRTHDVLTAAGYEHYEISNYA